MRLTSIVWGLYLGGLIGLYPCAAQQPITLAGVQGKLVLRMAQEVPLSEEIELLGNVWRGDVTREGLVVLADGNGAVIKYDQQGRQIARIGSFGEGPFEYENPIHLHVYGDTVIVWNAGNSKFIFYDIEGTPIREITGFKEAVKGFAYHDGRLFMHLGGQLRAHMMAVYDVERDAFVRTFAVRTTEDDLLARWIFSGVVDVRGDDFLFTRLAEPAIYRLNARTYEMTTHPVDEPDFKVKKVRKTYHDYSSKEKRAYFENNSRVSGLFVLDDYYVVQTENGRRETIDGVSEGMDRVYKLIFLDRQFNQIDHVVLDYDMRKKIGAWYWGVRFGEGNRLYFLEEQSGDDGQTVSWTLKVMEVGSGQP